jgi:ribokinase
MSDGSVVVVGSINVDLVVAVAKLPGPGETVNGGTYAQFGGGKGANQAVAAARLGVPVKMVGAVGADDFGEDALKNLGDEGVDTAAVTRLDGVPTGVAVIVVDARGENQIAVASGANAELTGEHVKSALSLDGSGVVLLGHEVPQAAVQAGVDAAREAGWTPILNPAPAREMIDDIEGVILTPNADEACRLANANDPVAAATQLFRQTNAPVLVTLGARGGLLIDADGMEMLSAPTVKVVDTTGAGDAVNGALAAELANGSDLHDAVRFALAAATLSTRVAGAREGMPRRDEVS